MAEKLINAGPNTEAGISVGYSSSRMHGTKENYVQTDNTGTFISGKLSLMSTMPHIRTGALWTFNSNWQMMIPSTLGTPSATLMVDPPMEQAKAIGEQVAVMGSLMGILSSIG